MDKKQIKALLAETDWAVLSDVELANKDDFLHYRSYLRECLINDMPYGSLQEPPQPVWTQPEETPDE